MVQYPPSQGRCRAPPTAHPSRWRPAAYGQLAGACYGVEAVPARWRERLALRERIEALAEGLLALAETGRSATP